jgi:hypothetical protein
VSRSQESRGTGETIFDPLVLVDCLTWSSIVVVGLVSYNALPGPLFPEAGSESTST